MAASSSVNVLILSANWRADLVKQFRRAASELGGGKVVVADMSPLSAALLAGDAAEVVPPLTDPGFPNHLVRICRKHSITAVIPSIDKDLPVLAGLKSTLASWKVVPVVPDPEAVAICDDKLRTYRFFVDNGFPTPKSWLPDELFSSPQKSKRPILIKPRRGIGGKGVYRITSQEELNFYLKRVPDPIFQEFLPGPEFSFDTLSDLDGKTVSVVPRERIYVRDGEVFKSRTVRDMKSIELVAEVAETLGLKGPAVVQGMHDESGQLKLTEVNPRFGSGVLLAIAAGADYPKDILRLVAGETVKPYLGEFADGLYMLRYYDAYFVDQAGLPQHGSLSP